MRTVTAEQMRALDEEASKGFLIPSLILMENAGRACADAVETALGTVPSGMFARTEPARGRIAVVAGPGNNGGDGIAAARHLHNRGYGVDVFLVFPEERIKGDALTNLRIAKKMSLVKGPVPDRLEGYDAVLDAILGTGSRKEACPEIVSAVRKILSAGSKVISVDIPTGMDPDTGGRFCECVKADITVTIALPKPFCAKPDAGPFCGRIMTAEIGFPAELIEQEQR